MRIDTIRAAGREIVAGKWVDDLPNLPGVALHVVGASSPEARRIGSALYAEIDEKDRKDPAVLEKMQRKLMAQALVIGWSGITNEKDEALEFSRDLLASLLDEEGTGAIFADAINFATDKVGKIDAEREKADVKN